MSYHKKDRLYFTEYIGNTLSSIWTQISHWTVGKDVLLESLERHITLRLDNILLNILWVIHYEPVGNITQCAK